MQQSDIIAVFGGTNDFGHGDAPLGTLTDTTTDSFCGSFHVLLNILKGKFPETKIFVITPLHRTTEDSPHGDGAKEEGEVLRKYVDAIIEIAGKEGVPVLNVFDDAPFPANEEYLMDGLHPNDKGHAVLSERILAYLNQLGWLE